jgi:hypothetical protein
MTPHLHYSFMLLRFKSLPVTIAFKISSNSIISCHSLRLPLLLAYSIFSSHFSSRELPRLGMNGIQSLSSEVGLDGVRE